MPFLPPLAATGDRQQVGVTTQQIHASADNVTLLAFADAAAIAVTGRTAANPPQRHAAVCRWEIMKQTDGRTLYRCTDIGIVRVNVRAWQLKYRALRKLLMDRPALLH